MNETRVASTERGVPLILYLLERSGHPWSTAAVSLAYTWSACRFRRAQGAKRHVVVDGDPYPRTTTLQRRRYGSTPGKQSLT
jgi:hypothetical protein